MVLIVRKCALTVCSALLILLAVSVVSGEEYQRMEYTEYGIPAHQSQFIFNNWLFNGGSGEYEFIISDFSYEGDGQVSGKAPAGLRTFEWKGYQWYVRNYDGEPGNNEWSDSQDNVWIDENNRLHLKIIDGQCAEVDSADSFLYGKFTFTVESDIANIDKDVVAAGFTYYNDVNELDIEFAKWGYQDGENAEYCVQPYYRSGNTKVFSTTYEGTTKHTIDWQKNKVTFISETIETAVVEEPAEETPDDQVLEEDNQSEEQTNEHVFQKTSKKVKSHTKKIWCSYRR